MNAPETPVETIVDASTPPPPKTRGRFFVELESARGIAALLVAGYHCSLTPILINGAQKRLRDLEETNALWQVLRWLHQHIVCGREHILHHGVLFFFVLSGFVLSDSLEHGPAPIGRAGGRFGIARFFRIYPAVIVTVLVFWLAYIFGGLALDADGYNVRSLLNNALLLRTNIDGVMWTIQTELLAIPLIFAAFLVKKRWGLGAVGVMALTLTIMSFAGWWENLGSVQPSRTAWLYMFLFGILTYYLGQKWGPTLRQSAASAIFLGAAAIFFFIGVVIHHKWELLFQALAASVMIAVVAFAPKNSATAFLRVPPFRFLGRISYSFYLLHPLALAVIWFQPKLIGAWVERGAPVTLVAAVLWILTTAAILPLAWLTYRTIELPFIRLGKRIWNLISGHPAAGLARGLY